jgi:serine/threonine protein kinase
MGIAELFVVLPLAALVIAVFYGIRAVARFFDRQRRAVAALERAAAPVPPPAVQPSPHATHTQAVPARPVVALTPGAVFASRYRIVRLLGSGGMGVVYEAWDNELESAVALKLILPEITADPVKSGIFAQRLKQELQLARRVTHRNVLRIHDIGEWAGARYITMPLVDGGDLTAVLRDAPLAVDRAIAIWRQVVEGLQAAHDERVIHRDLKPQNILLGPGDRVFVSDFGLAKSLEAGSANLTNTGEMHCTPRYVSPEQLTGKPADPRSDLYALGLILHEMLVGDIPFSGNSPMEIMFARLGDPPADPRRFNAEIPEGVARLILRSLEKEPDRRYQNAGEMLTDLDAARAARAS